MGSARGPAVTRSTSQTNPATIPPSAGRPSAGTAQVSETLTARTSGIKDSNGLDNVSYSYQWLADNTDISGATAATYTVSAAHVDKTIKVRVSFTDDDDNAETLASAGVGPVTHKISEQQTEDEEAEDEEAEDEEAEEEETVLPDPPSAPRELISESVASNSVRLSWLPPRRGTVDGYQVLRRARDRDAYGDSLGPGEYIVVGETTSSDARSGALFTDTTVTPGTRYRYRVKASNAGGLSPRSSGHLVDVPEQSGNHPAFGGPSITGTAQVGETLTARTSGIKDSNGLDNVSYSYQWLADNTDISGATATSYTAGNRRPRTRPSRCGCRSPTTTTRPRPSPAQAWDRSSSRRTASLRRTTSSRRATSSSRTTNRRRATSPSRTTCRFRTPSRRARRPSAARRRWARPWRRAPRASTTPTGWRMRRSATSGWPTTPTSQTPPQPATRWPPPTSKRPSRCGCRSPTTSATPKS